ncbi:uncharacterized protein LOC120653349 [Panicum virgatum]|uniref:uncharacterized protein LOC120653349 n=1 Tax=Panicum virgatum TaxID=38727 RepID=UPI0019D60F9A|nr:uncharacterized protein LOC120653349 [Panicum virgatum]
MVPLGLKVAEVPVVYSDPVIQLVFSNLPPYLRQKNILTYMGAHYKRWRQRCVLWLTAMHYYFVVEPRPLGPHTAKDEQRFKDADTTFKGAMISMLGDSMVDTYVMMSTAKEMWNTLEAKYRASDAGSELYVMEQFYDYRMLEDCSVIEQAHDIQTLVKELENFCCVLPKKFVAGCIIAKLPQTWTNFANSLKHERQEFGIADLIGSLDVEEEARAKDVRGKKVVEANSSAHVVQKGHRNSHKKKFKQELKQKNTTPFMKKKKNQRNKGKGKCYICGVEGHYATE